MQTVTLEFATEPLVALGLIPAGFFERYEEVELLETLRLEAGWRLQLVRVRRRGPLKTAAELLGISFRSIRYKLAKYGISDADSEET